MNKISQAGLFSVMLCGHAFSLMTFFPRTIDDPAEYMIGALISTAFEFLLLIPVYLLYRRFDGASPLTVCEGMNAMQKLSGIFYGAVFVFFAYRVIGNFSYFLDSVVSGYFPRTLTVIMICAAALYLGTMSPSVIGRVGGIMLALFLCFAAVVLVCSFGRSEQGFSGFHLASDDLPKGIAEAVKCDLLRNMDLVFLLFFMPKQKGSPVKTGALYLFAKLVLVEFSVGFVTLMLGDYAMSAKLPFSAMASYSSSSMVERFDAVFMAVWVILAIVRLGAVFHCCADCICAAVPKLGRQPALIASAVLPALTALITLTRYDWERTAYDMSGWVVMCIAMLSPFVVIAAKVRSERGAVAADEQE